MKQNWIRSPWFDMTWIFGPLFLPVGLVFCFPSVFQNSDQELSLAAWVILVLMVDVAHVYSTVYRSYFNKKAWKEYSMALRLVPALCWFAGVLLYSLAPGLFWRCMAYLAVFHFIRQQYGFLRIYSRQENLSSFASAVYSIAVYSAALIPVLIWHAQGPKNFNWFTENDFYYVNLPALITPLKTVFFTVLIFFLAYELYAWLKHGLVNLLRVLWVSGTAFSWYTGIVWCNGDLTFTMLNVLAHGIPYMALVWAAEKRTEERNHPAFIRMAFKTYGVVLFVGILLLFAFVEEGLWDALVWRERGSLFQIFYGFNQAHQSWLLAFLVPLLSLPQTVHYVLDGFIWKIRKSKDGISLG